MCSHNIYICAQHELQYGLTQYACGERTAENRHGGEESDYSTSFLLALVHDERIFLLTWTTSATRKRKKKRTRASSAHKIKSLSVLAREVGSAGRAPGRPSSRRHPSAFVLKIREHFMIFSLHSELRTHVQLTVVCMARKHEPTVFVALLLCWVWAVSSRGDVGYGFSSAD